jgi:hypothetical protein
MEGSRLVCGEAGEASTTPAAGVKKPQRTTRLEAGR